MKVLKNKLLMFLRQLRHLADGLWAGIRRILFRNCKAPKVKEELSELPPIKSTDYDTEDLNVNNPKLILLYERYRSKTPFIEIVSPLWHDPPKDLNLREFRSHSRYVWTKESSLRYNFTTYHISKFDRYDLLRLFGEDGAFGCNVVKLPNGTLVSRDKLDSIMEIYYLIKNFGIGPFDKFRVLDIGAGYGRLAHRFTTLFKNVEYYCVDAIPVSTFLCEFYLGFREAKNAYVVPFDNLDVLQKDKFDFAVCVHSFGEQTIKSIEYWMEILDRLDLRKLVVIDNDGKWTTMEPPDNRKSYYLPILEKHDWVLIDARPKYTTLSAHILGIYAKSVFAVFVR